MRPALETRQTASGGLQHPLMWSYPHAMTSDELDLRERDHLSLTWVPELNVFLFTVAKRCYNKNELLTTMDYLIRNLELARDRIRRA